MHTKQIPVMRIVALIPILLVSACASVPGPDKSAAGALLGAGWGAGAGAVIGNQMNALGPGAAIGAGFGAAAGLLTGIGLDLEEGTDLAQQRELDALRIQVAQNQRALAMLQDSLDDRDQKLKTTAAPSEIYFDRARASLRAGSVVQLERIANMVKLNPYVGVVELHGHADDLGTPETNLRLSEARARTVATFLANAGVSMDQIRIISHGAQLPLASNETESGRQLNRRVEIVFLR